MINLIEIWLSSLISLILLQVNSNGLVKAMFNYYKHKILHCLTIKIERTNYKNRRRKKNIIKATINIIIKAFLVRFICICVLSNHVSLG